MSAGTMQWLPVKPVLNWANTKGYAIINTGGWGERAEYESV